MLWGGIWPAPVVLLYVVSPWKPCDLTPHLPYRYVGPCRHLSPPVGTFCRWGALVGMPRSARSLPPRT